MGVLRAKVGGVWVDVVGSGSDEVFVGTDDPIGVIPSTELWYDTDDPTGDAAAAFQFAKGIIAFRQATASGFTVATGTATDITVTAGQAPSIAGLALDPARRYRMNLLAAVSIGTVNTRGVFDFYMDATALGTWTYSRNYGASALDEFWSFLFVPADASAHTWKIMARSPDAATIGFGGATAQHPLQFSIEDVGPV